MGIKLGIIIDPIEQLDITKDSSMALGLAAQQKNWEVFYLTQHDIFYSSGVCAKITAIKINKANWQYSILSKQTINLNTLDVILMRKDPPVDMEFLHITQFLVKLQQEGVLVVNDPLSLQKFNEKIIVTEFPELAPKTIISSNREELIEFAKQHANIVLKPLDGMGGTSIFKTYYNDPNINVIIDTITNQRQLHVIAQKFIPEITSGDKRVFIVNGKPIPYALVRIPQDGEFRGNLAAGAKGKGQPLTKQDMHIATQVADYLLDNGILFAGLDIIGEFLTEINITSPTGIRELDSMFSIDIAGQLMDAIEKLI